jgi:hypothetical protein
MALAMKISNKFFIGGFLILALLVFVSGCQQPAESAGEAKQSAPAAQQQPAMA